MADPMTDAEIEALRTMPFTTSLNVGCAVYATDEEKHLHRLAVENHNAKLQVIAELKRVRAELAEARKPKPPSMADAFEMFRDQVLNEEWRDA